MSESERVQRWRRRQREAGKEPLTIWLTTAEKLHLEDMALTQRCSPSELIEHLLAQWHGEVLPVTDTVTDTEQIRALMQHELALAHDVTATVTDTITATVQQLLPALVRAFLQEQQARIVTDTITDTITATTSAHTAKRKAPARQRPVTATVADNVTVTEPKHRGRPPVLRPGILALLDEHPDGLTAAELKVYLGTEKHIGDTLAGMVKAQLLVRNGTGQGLRYQRAEVA